MILMVFADYHSDAITAMNPRRFLRHIKNAAETGVEIIFVSVWTTEMKNPMQEIRRYRQIIDRVAARVPGIRLNLHIEDAWFVGEHNIDALIELKPHSVGLTWNHNNSFAGGAHGDGNLTPAGRCVIEKLVRHGITIDLAHLNKESFYDVAAVLQGTKLFCSHTCFYEVNPHPRNLDRGQVQTIVDSGGVIGLTLVGEFIGRAGIHAHIKHFTENHGAGCLGIGSDFFGGADIKGLGSYRQLKELCEILT